MSTDNETISVFINWLLPVIIQPSFSSVRREQPRYFLKLNRVVLFAHDEGDSNRASQSRTSVGSVFPTNKPVLDRAHENRAVRAIITILPLTKRVIYFMEPTNHSSSFGANFVEKPEENV